MSAGYFPEEVLHILSDLELLQGPVGRVGQCGREGHLGCFA